jgi:hypothetical protein
MKRHTGLTDVDLLVSSPASLRPTVRARRPHRPAQPSVTRISLTEMTSRMLLED